MRYTFLLKPYTLLHNHFISNKYTTDLLLTQISIGPSPSPLLVSYLQYGMITRLVHPLDFFTRLPTVVSPSRPVQLNSYPFSMIFLLLHSLYDLYDQHSQIISPYF